MVHPVFDLPTPFVIAHRGGAGEAPENSMAAFRRAVELGAAVVETDLQVTADGVCVVSHDATLDRTTDATGRIGELAWSSVRRARIAGAEPVLRLEELLEQLPGVPVNLDLKSDAVVPAFVTAVRSTCELERICVGSFSDRRLQLARQALGPRLATSLGPRQVARLALTGASVGTPGMVAAQVPERAGPVRIVTERLVRRAAAAGLQVHVWTVDDPVAMRRLLRLGVAGLMTDRPSLALAAIARFRACLD